jgi:hypothetical protein
MLLSGYNQCIETMMTNTFDKKSRDVILDRLNSYIISLKEHILEIVHSESEEFLALASSLA